MATSTLVFPPNASSMSKYRRKRESFDSLSSEIPGEKGWGSLIGGGKEGEEGEKRAWYG